MYYFEETTTTPFLRNNFVQHTLYEVIRDLFNQLKALDKQTNHPLYVLNNDVLKEKLNLDELNIKSVKVLTGANALEKYGDAAKNGVVVVSSK